MKNKILIVTMIIFFIIGMIILSVYLNNIPSTEQSEEKITEKSEVEIMQVTSSNFEEEVLKSEKTVLIDFYADWCGPCKTYSPIVKKFASENKDIKVVKVNVDDSQDLAIKYNAMSIPTTVIIKNGEEVNRAVGVISKSYLTQLVND